MVLVKTAWGMEWHFTEEKEDWAAWFYIDGKWEAGLDTESDERLRKKLYV